MVERRNGTETGAVKHTIIYGLIESDTGKLRYVGKTTCGLAQRLARHRKHRDDSHRARWIAAVYARGATVAATVIETVEPGDDWEAAEQRWIAHYRALGVDLVNSTAGGDGLHDPSPELRAKMRAWRLGSKQSPEAIEKQRAKVTGLRRTLEQRERYSEAAKKRGGFGESARQRALEVNRGRVFTEEHRRKISEAGKGRKISARQIAAMVEGRHNADLTGAFTKMTETWRSKAESAEQRQEWASYLGDAAKPSLTPEQIERARAMRTEGLSYAKIGAALSINHAAVRRAVLGIGACYGGSPANPGCRGRRW
jgi:hypothetical protein